jgi:hypothetical protein
MKDTAIWLVAASFGGAASALLLVGGLLVTLSAEAQPVPVECPACVCPPPPPCLELEPARLLSPNPEAIEAVKKALEAIKAAEQQTTQQIGPKP